MRMMCVSLLAVACVSPCDGEPSLEIGGANDTGTGGFEAFADGADRHLVFGVQGGYHVYLQLRMRGLCPESTTVERQAIDESGAVRVYTRGPLPFVEAGDAYELATAERMILCPPTDALPVIDQPMRFSVAVTDAAGSHAEAEIGLVPRCIDGGRCEMLCAP